MITKHAEKRKWVSGMIKTTILSQRNHILQPSTSTGCISFHHSPTKHRAKRTPTITHMFYFLRRRWLVDWIYLGNKNWSVYSKCCRQRSRQQHCCCQEEQVNDEPLHDAMIVINDDDRNARVQPPHNVKRELFFPPVVETSVPIRI